MAGVNYADDWEKLMAAKSSGKTSSYLTEYLSKNQTETPSAPITITPTSDGSKLSVTKEALEAARINEQKAIAAANQYVTDNMGWLDMKDPAELEALNSAAKAATAERERLEREYISLPGAYEDKFEGIGDTGKAFATVISKPFLAADVAAETVKAAAKGEKVDNTSLASLKYQELNKAREDALSETSGFGRTLANTGLSIADNLYSRLLGLGSNVGTGLVMGATASADKMNELNQQGEDAGRSLVRGVISGGIEGATEALPIGTLANMIKTGGKGIVKNLLTQSGVEATEEGISYVANYIADKAFKDPNAKFDWNEFKESVVSGGLSGLFFGLGGTAIGGINSQTTANPEIQPTTPSNDVTATTAPSEQKTAPNAVNGLEAVNDNIEVAPATGEATAVSQLRPAGSEGSVPPPNTVTNENENVKQIVDSMLADKKADKSISNILNTILSTKNDDASKSEALNAFNALFNNNEYGVNANGMLRKTDAENHIDNRSFSSVGDTRIPSFQYDNPVLHNFFVDAAGMMQEDLAWSTRGERFMVGDADGYGSTKKWAGTKRKTTPEVATLKDDARLTYAELDKALENIIADKGQENYAAAKRVEIVLDQMLTNGYQNMQGEWVEPNQAYIEAKSKIPGASPVAEVEADNDPLPLYNEQERREMGYGQNTVGSAQAQFAYQEAPTQSVADNLFTEQELQGQNLRNKHQVYSDAQANALADQLLAQDYEGEVSRLRDPDAVWDKTANVEGYRILEKLIDKARKSGREADWDAVREWKALYDRKGGTEHAQALQGRAQFATGTAEIVAEAAETLEGPDIRKLNPQKKAQLLDEVYNQAEAYNGIEAGDLDSLISLIERNSEIRRTTGLFSKKTAKQMDWALHQVAEKYTDTAEQFLRNVAVAQIRNIASDYNKVGVTEGAKSVRIMNMLSKVSTVMRNLVSNNIFDPLEAISGDVGVIADLIMSKMTGQRTTTFDRSWTSKAKRAGTLEGALKSYIEVGLDAPAQDATSRYEGTGSGRTFKMTGNIVERFLSTWSKYENYALQTTDEAQKGGIRAETQRQIDSLKASGKLDSDALNEWANETARQRTFQNDSKLAKAATGLRSAANYFHVGDIGAGDILFPFAKVPANLVSQSANYSPLGLLRSVVEVAVDAKRGTVDAEKQARVARNFGRGVTGTALLAGFAALASKGLIDVAGADDDDKEALERAQGKTGTQWNLSATLRALNGGDATWKDDDLLMSIGFLDPLNSIMAAGSLLADDYAEKGKLTIGGIGEATVGSLWQSLMDLPAVTSLNDIINAYKYSDAETGAGKVWDTIVDYGGSQLASFVVPNALRGIATGLDDTVRNQYSGETAKETTLDSIKSGVPGLRETLPASLDPFGREKTQTGNTLLNFLNNNVLPGSITRYNETTVEKVLENLYGVTGEAGIYPDRKAPNSFSVNKEKITLDAEDKDQFMKVAGSTAESLMDDLVKSNTFTSASEEEQAAYLKLANEYARAMAKYDLTNGKYELSGFAKSAEKAMDAGINLSDYLMYYSGKPEYNTDGNSSYSNAENLKAVEESGFTGDALTALYMITFPDWVNSAAKKGVDFMRYVEYKKVTNGASKKADKISALIAAGYNSVQANQMYKEME